MTRPAQAPLSVQPQTPPPSRWPALDAARALLLRRPHLIELAALVGILAVLGAWTIPAHVASLWHDPEFTGWVAPIANRIAAGQRLYTDGGHSPMPPLPALLLLPAAGHAGWLAESAAHFLFQALTVLVLYFAFARHLSRAIALVAALATLPNFLSLPKAILYDPMAQFFVALTIQQLLEHLARRREPRPGLARRRALAGAGAATAALFLTKQSTAAGALAGVLLALALARGLGLRDRAREIGVYLGATAIAAALLLGLMAPWVSPAGFWVDVIATGAEVKGGQGAMLAALQKSLATIITNTFTGSLPGGVILAALVAMFLVAPARARGAGRPTAPTSSAWLALACTGSFLLLGAVTIGLQVRYGDQALEGAILFALAIAALARCTRRPAAAPPGLDLLFAALCVAVPAALGHNLSVGYLRWTYDNNPLTPVALAVLATVLLDAARTLGVGLSPPALAAMVLVLLQGLTSGRALERWESLQSCTERWPEVRHLGGARLPPSAEGMRDLVKRVRALAAAGTDEVLLLPDDPDVHAWFERRRPPLSSQIVFTDQYRDRYVDEDFRRLSAHPPKVIVIGPRNSWRPFTRMWHPGLGAERLIDRLQRELLPVRYHRAAEQPITYQKRAELMDVFVLNSPG